VPVGGSDAGAGHDSSISEASFKSGQGRFEGFVRRVSSTLGTASTASGNVRQSR